MAASVKTVGLRKLTVQIGQPKHLRCNTLSKFTITLQKRGILLRHGVRTTSTAQVGKNIQIGVDSK